MNFKAISLGIGGLCIIGGWLLRENWKSKQKLPSKQETLQILQVVRQQFYPILIKIAEFVTKQLAPRGLTPQQNQKIVMLDPTIRAQIQKINEKIYQKFSENDVQEAAQKTYKDDGDILKQKNQFKEQYKKCFLGIKPEQKMIISRKIHKVQILKVVSELLEDKIYRLETQKREGMTDNQISSFLQKDVQEDERVTKQKIKLKLGLCAKDSIKIFHFAVVEYKKSDQNFRYKYEEIVKSYNQKIKLLFIK